MATPTLVTLLSPTPLWSDDRNQRSCDLSKQILPFDSYNKV